LSQEIDKVQLIEMKLKKMEEDDSSDDGEEEEDENNPNDSGSKNKKNLNFERPQSRLRDQLNKSIEYGRSGNTSHTNSI